MRAFAPSATSPHSWAGQFGSTHRTLRRASSPRWCPMMLIVYIAGGIVLGWLGLAVVREWAGRRLQRGQSVAGGVFKLALQALSACVLLGGALYLWSSSESDRQRRAWQLYQDSVPRKRKDCDRPVSGLPRSSALVCCVGRRAVADSLCDRWTIDSAPPAALGLGVPRTRPPAIRAPWRDHREVALLHELSILSRA